MALIVICISTLTNSAVQTPQNLTKIRIYCKIKNKGIENEKK